MFPCITRHRIAKIATVSINSHEVLCYVINSLIITARECCEYGLKDVVLSQANHLYTAPPPLPPRGVGYCWLAWGLGVCEFTDYKV
jgi:hypothetical protein